MAVIEVEGYKLDERKLMKVRIPPEKGEGEMRLILPTTSWNTSGKFLLHDLTTGRIAQVESIVKLLQDHHLLDEVKAPE